MPPPPQPTPALPEPGARRRPRRLLRRFAALCLLAGALLALLYLTRGATLHPLLVRSAPALSRWFSPYEVRLEAIEGDWRRTLTLRGVELRALGDEPGVLRGVTARSVSVEGRLLRAARRGDPAALAAVRLDSPDVALGPGAEGPEREPAPWSWPALPELSIRGGVLRYEGAGDPVEVRGIEISGAGTPASPLEIAARGDVPGWSARVEGRAVLEDPRTVRFDLDVPEAVASDVPIAGTGLSGAWSPGSARIDAGRVEIGSGELRVEGLGIRQGGAGLRIEGDVRFEFADLGEARRALSAFTGAAAPAAWAGSARGTARLVPDGDGGVRGSLDVQGEDVVAAGVELGTVAARAEADGETIEVTRLRASTARGTEIEGTGRYLLGPRALADVALEVRLDQPGDVNAGLAVLGGVALDLEVEGPVTAPSGIVRARAAALRLGGVEVSDLAVDGGMTGGVVELSAARVETPFGALGAGGSLVLPLGGRSLGATLDSLSLEGRGGALALARPATLELGEDGVRASGLRLTGTAGSLELDLDSSADGRVEARARGLRLAPFLPARDGVPGELEGLLGPIEGTASYDGASRTASVALAMEVEGAPDGGRVTADWDGTTLDVEDLRLALPSGSVNGSGRLALAAGGPPDPDGALALDLSLALDAGLLGWAPLAARLDPALRSTLERLRGSARVDLDLEGTWADPRGTVGMTLEGGGMVAAAGGGEPGASAPDVLPRPLTAEVELRLGEAVEISAGRIGLVDCVGLALAGTVEGGLDLAALAADPADTRERWGGRGLDLTATLESEGLEELAALMPELREVRGQLEGQLRVRGTVGAPEFVGELVLAECATRLRGLPPVENLNARVAFEERQVRVEGGRLELGASPVSFAGNVLLGQGDPRIDGTIKGEQVLLVRSEDARLRADLDLEVHGRSSALTLGGTVEITDGRIRSPIEFQSLLEGGGAAPPSVTRGIRIPGFGPPSVRLDARVVTSQPVTLQGRIARGGIRADLALRGTADAPVPVGDLFFDPLELAVPAGVITFPTGLVRFDRSQPDVPRVDIVGTTRLAGYDVTVSVEGEYDRPDVELSSSPSLPADDLLLLVLSGQPPSAGRGLGAAGQTVALYVAKDLVRGWFSSGGFEDEDRQSFLDRLEVVTGRDVSRSGVLTIEATYLLREGFAREADALYAVFERDPYEDFGIGLRLVLRLR